METTSCACVISICYLRDGALAEDAAQETFVRAVLGLPGKYREVVVQAARADGVEIAGLVTFHDGFRYFAQALDLPQGTVSIRLKRARERLKPALKEWYYAVWTSAYARTLS